MAITQHLSSVPARSIRNLKAAIDDNCDYTAPIMRTQASPSTKKRGWVNSAGATRRLLPNGGFPYCRMFNPGEDAVFLTDFFDDGTLTFDDRTGRQLPRRLAAPTRRSSCSGTAAGTRSSCKRPTPGSNKGNTEGGVKSDIGQTDTNVTSDFDYKELAVDSYGYLPNDRRHAFKIFGSYALTDELSIGSNLLAQSGRPKNCLGVLFPFHGGIHPYGSQFFRCGTTAAGGTGPVEIVPRGTAGRLPWTWSVDLSLAYSPRWVDGLTAKMDVFNLFNQQEVLAVEDRAEDAATGVPSPTYLVPRAFQAPRFFQFSVQYKF